MPAKSQSQARLMQAVAHSPEFAKKTGIPQKVGKEYASATVKALRSLPERVKTTR